MTKIRNERGTLLWNLQKKLKSDIKEYYENLYNNKLNNLDEIDKFLERFKLLNLMQE